jgi:nucleoside-diphosphate-sugar epimerase
VSNRRAREELGWEPRISLEEGMARTEEWLGREGLI